MPTLIKTNFLLTTGPVSVTLEWEWDGKLRSATKGSDSMAVKYDPMGNRVYKSSYDGSTTTTRKYIVDISGKLPTILCEIDTSDSSLTKSYYYANAQILAQREHTANPAVYDEYFYVHDRLGSVRMVVAYNGTDAVNTVNSYTYTPFGDFYGTPDETVDNPFKFTGQWYDAEINQYYLRARQYDPTMMRFISRDSVRGKQAKPLTLHPYLYCLNNSINKRDPSGRLGQNLTGAVYGGYAMHAAAIGTAAYGVATGNDNFLNAGIAMETGIVAGMAIGAVLQYPEIIKEAIGLYAAVSVISAYTDEGRMDVFGVLTGDPHEVSTIAGFNAKMIVGTFNWISEVDYDEYMEALGWDSWMETGSDFGHARGRHRKKN